MNLERLIDWHRMFGRDGDPHPYAKFHREAAEYLEQLREEALYFIPHFRADNSE